MALSVLYCIIPFGKLTPHSLITLSFPFILSGNQLILVLVKVLIKIAFKWHPVRAFCTILVLDTVTGEYMLGKR